MKAKHFIYAWTLVVALTVTLSGCGEEPNIGDNVSLNHSTLVLRPGESEQLQLQPELNNAKLVKWIVRHTKIASVSSTGLVKAKTIGTTDIIVEFDGKSLVCKLEVKNSDLKLNTSGRLYPLNANSFKQYIWDYDRYPNVFRYNLNLPSVVMFWSNDVPQSANYKVVMEGMANKYAGSASIFTVDLGNLSAKTKEATILSSFIALGVNGLSDKVLPAFVMISANNTPLIGANGTSSTTDEVQTFLNKETNFRSSEPEK